MYVARRVLDGARLYVDLVEVNPPLIVWLNLPLVAFARGVGWSEVAVYRAAVWMAAAASLWLIYSLLYVTLDREDGYRRAGLFLGSLLLLVAFPGPYFGQREHLVLILLLPWLFASAARAGGQSIGRAAGVSAGLMAGVGLALKPHYIPAALGIAVYVRMASPTAKRGIPPEQALAAVMLVLYAGAVFVVAPEYVEVVSRLGTTYWDYLRRSPSRMLLGGLLPLTVTASAVLWPLIRRLTRYRALADVFGIAVVGFLGAVVLQSKGFGYHYYPALGGGLLALLLGVMGNGETAPSLPAWMPGRALALVVGFPMIAALLFATIDRASGGAGRWSETAGNREVAGFLGAQQPSRPIVVLSPRMDDSFPFFLESGLVWGSRYPFMWFVGALHRDELKSGAGRITCRRPSHHASAERELLGSVGEDLRLHRPALVLVRRPKDGDLVPVNLLACFSRDSTFRQEFGAYRRRAELEHFVVFERVSP